MTSPLLQVGSEPDLEGEVEATILEELYTTLASDDTSPNDPRSHQFAADLKCCQQSLNNLRVWPCPTKYTKSHSNNLMYLHPPHLHTFSFLLFATGVRGIAAHALIPPIPTVRAVTCSQPAFLSCATFDLVLPTAE